MDHNNHRPITEKQRQARRENGKKARGATTAEGKARSARNATKHGYWARGLRAIDSGPLREDPAEVGAFVDAFLTELDPGDSVILRQAAIDAADKAWRLTRAQRWEAEGYAGASHASAEASRADWLRSLAADDGRRAETIRTFPDPAVSDDDMIRALCSLSFAVGVSEEDLEWVEDGDAAEVTAALATLIDAHFADQEEAASYLDGRAAERETQANDLQHVGRSTVIRQEMDGSFARNAERLVSNASREYDRSLRRYKDLFDRYRDANDTDDGHEPYQDDDPAPDGGSVGPGDTDAIWSRIDADDPVPDGGTVGPGDGDIWSRVNANDVVEYFTNLLATAGLEPPPRNEPTGGGE